MKKPISGLDIYAINDTKKGTAKSNRSAYDRWISMLKRCHDPKHKDFYKYGAKGVYVSLEFRFFSAYLDWYTGECSKLGIDPNSNNYEVDKDVRLEGSTKKFYGLDSCKLLPSSENPKGRPGKEFLIRDPSGVIHCAVNMKRFCDENKIPVQAVHVMVNKITTSQGKRVLSVKGWTSVD